MANLNSPLTDTDLISTNNNGSSDLLPLLVTGGLSSLTIGITKVFVPLHALALNANEFQIGLVSAAMSLGMLLMSLPAGKLLSLVNVKHSFSFGLFLSIFVYLSFYIIDNAWLFILSIVFLSATFPFRFIALQKKFLFLLKSLGSTSAGWLRATQMLGTFVLGPIIAGFYLGIGSLGDLPLLIIIILSICIFLSLSTSGLHLPAKHIQRENTEFQLSSACTAKTNARLNGAYGIEMAMAASMNIFNGFCVLLAANHYGLEASEGASLIVWQGAGFALCLLFGGSVAARLNVQTALWVCLAISIISLFLLPFTWLLWQAKILALVMGISMALLTIFNMGTFSDLSRDEESSRKIATMSVFMVPLGAVIGTVLAGITAHYLNLDFVYFLAAFFVLSAAAYMAFLNKRFRLQEVKHV